MVDFITSVFVLVLAPVQAPSQTREPPFAEPPAKAERGPDKPWVPGKPWDVSSFTRIFGPLPRADDKPLPPGVQRGPMPRIIEIPQGCGAYEGWWSRADGRMFKMPPKAPDKKSVVQPGPVCAVVNFKIGGRELTFYRDERGNWVPAEQPNDPLFDSNLARGGDKPLPAGTQSGPMPRVIWPLEGPFNIIPKIIVTPKHISDQGGCAGGAVFSDPLLRKMQEAMKDLPPEEKLRLLEEIRKSLESSLPKDKK